MTPALAMIRRGCLLNVSHVMCLGTCLHDADYDYDYDYDSHSGKSRSLENWEPEVTLR